MKEHVIRVKLSVLGSLKSECLASINKFSLIQDDVLGREPELIFINHAEIN
jgi:hypothetical protein